MAATWLDRTIGSPTLGTKFTWSAWVKKCVNGIYQHMATTTANPGNWDSIRFDSSDRFEVTLSNTAAVYVTTRVFRDDTSWYHFCVAVDTTLASGGDRIKIWVNGVEETAFDTETDASQDVVYNFQTSGKTYRIGANTWNTTHERFDGLMTHVHWVDGTAYDASTFGSTDATTGQWKINTNPTVTYGNNGFFLFKNDSALTDQSPNTNNFSLTSGTLTTNIDNPSNNFCTWNKLWNGAATFSYYRGNLDVSAEGSSWYATQGTLGFNKGKYYWEFSDLGTECQMGVADASIYQESSNPQDLTGTTCFYNNLGGEMRKDGVTTDNDYGTFGSTDIMGVAVDMDSNTISIYKNGSIIVTDYALSTSIKMAMPFIANYGTGNLVTTNFGGGVMNTTAVSSAGTNASGNGTFEYDVPANHTALSTKGMNL